MIAIFASPIYILVNWYIVRRSLKWMRACHGMFAHPVYRACYCVVYALLASTVLIAFLLPGGSALQRAFKLISNYWFGTFAYIILFTAIADFCKIVLHAAGLLKEDVYQSRRAFALAGACVGVLVVSMSIYGMVNARRLVTTAYDVQVNKTCAAGSELNVVLIADTHLGYSIGTPQVQQMVAQINALHPDVVCFAGDIFDNEYEALDDPAALIAAFSSIQSRYGVYACWGNHDIEERILAGFTFDSKGVKLADPRMRSFVKQCGITLLEDQSVLVGDSFYLAGRRDAEKPNDSDNTRLSPQQLLAGLDRTKPVIVLDHEPRQLAALAAAGADLDLCGHTHAGQMFPGNLTVRLMWENAYGLKKVGGMTNIVTSGVGVFGPYMRTFTRAEIVQVRVHFQSAG